MLRLIRLRRQLRKQATAAARVAAVVFPIAAFLLAGCSRSPGRVESPDWDPADLSARILETLDKNTDGQVDAEELKAAPGLAAGARFVDANKDDRLSSDEIQARIALYRDLRVGLRAQQFRLTYKGAPLVGAEVKFIPEPFLEGVIQPARGTTDDQGVVVPQAEGEDLPAMRIGYYRVQVASANRKIPAKYADGTALGVEVSTISDDASSYGTPELRLTD